jgi:hypothetical protein
MILPSIFLETSLRSFGPSHRYACWYHSQTYRYESLLSLHAKMLLWNSVSQEFLFELYAKRPDMERVGELGMKPFSGRLFRQLTGVRATQLSEAMTKYYLGDSDASHLANFRCCWFRACPNCLCQQFHSEVHQIFFIALCPIHECSLQIYGSCSPKDLSKTFGPLRRLKANSIEVVNAEDNCAKADAFEGVAKWLHEDVGGRGLIDRTIVSRRFFLPDSSAPSRRDSFLVARVNTLTELWMNASLPLSHLLRSKGTAQDGKIQVAVVRKRQRRCVSTEESFVRIYRNIREVLEKRYYDRNGLSVDQLLSCWQEGRGDGSHRALDVLLWRTFWEGAVDLQRLVRVREDETNRLSPVLEQGVVQVFGGLQWIERRYGQVFVQWLFEQILTWTFVERGRLTNWCKRRRLPLYTCLRGSMLPAIMVEEQAEVLVVYYKFCPDQRMLVRAG